MMHPGILVEQRTGEDCRSFTLTRGKERGRTHSEAMLSSLVHAFRQSSVKKKEKTLRRTLVCGSQRPPTLKKTHSSTSSPVSSAFPLFCLFPLHYSTSCLCCFCSGPSLSAFFFPFSTEVALSLYFHSSLLFLFSLVLSASLFVASSDEQEGWASPLFLWTWGCETLLGFIYIFLALSWSLLLLILLFQND